MNGPLRRSPRARVATKVLGELHSLGTQAIMKVVRIGTHKIGRSVAVAASQPAATHESAAFSKSAALPPVTIV